MKIELLPTSSLRINPDNPRVIRDERYAKLVKSIREFPKMLEIRPIVVNSDMMVLGGNMRLRACKEAGLKKVPVIRADELTEDEQRRFIIADNVAFGEHDWDTLANEWDAEQLADWGLELPIFDAQEEEETSEPATPAEARKTLAERFIIPPFSIFDTRQGYWQERKRKWLALGIKSELGRGENVLDMSATMAGITDEERRKEWNEARRNSPKHSGGQTLGAIPPNERQIMKRQGKYKTGGGMSKQHVTGLLMTSDSGNDPAYYFKKQSAEKKAGRELTTEEFQRDWYEGPDSYASGTSIFDPVLCELAYRWFCTEGGTVVDPFAGGSVRGIVAAILGYNYIGVELRAEQVQANRDNAAEVLGERENYPVWHCGDSIGIDGICKGVEADLVFSCPPYADLEVYSDLPGDISNMDYPEFMAAYREIIQKAVGLLKENRFACFVVGDVRDKKGFYHGFVPDTIRAFEDAGAKLYNEIILVNVAGSLPIRAGKQFEAGRKVGKMHQNILVFYKGDPKQIRKNFPAIQLPDTE